MVERDAAGFGQMKLSSAPVEERMAELLFKFADLHRER